jgi:hypothetical protein
MVLLCVPDKHHLHRLHSVLVGDPQAVVELYFKAQAFEHIVYFGAAPVHDNGFTPTYFSSVMS